MLRKKKMLIKTKNGSSVWRRRWRVVPRPPPNRAMGQRGLSLAPCVWQMLSMRDAVLTTVPPPGPAAGGTDGEGLNPSLGRLTRDILPCSGVRRSLPPPPAGRNKSEVYFRIGILFQRKDDVPLCEPLKQSFQSSGIAGIQFLLFPLPTTALCSKRFDGFPNLV